MAREKYDYLKISYETSDTMIFYIYYTVVLVLRHLCAMKIEKKKPNYLFHILITQDMKIKTSTYFMKYFSLQLKNV